MPRFGGFVTRSHGCHQPPQWPLFVVAVVVVVAVDGAVVAAVVSHDETSRRSLIDASLVIYRWLLHDTHNCHISFRLTSIITLFVSFPVDF